VEWKFALSPAWGEIAKARWDLGRRDEALAAFREAAAAQRQVFEHDPSVVIHRRLLSRDYDKLVYWGGLHGDWAGVAAALREREKLWPDNAEELLEVSRDFEQLTQQMAESRRPLSPEEEAQRWRYLAESARARQAAEAVARRRAAQP
jgi:tetratricopeptide (TPR) repeat protein